jgi:hypothetical protein
MHLIERSSERLAVFLYSDKYRPEVGVSEELNAELTTYYKELISILQWAVEIGRGDVLL